MYGFLKIGSKIFLPPVLCLVCHEAQLIPIEEKRRIWAKLAGPWQIDLGQLEEVLTLDTLSDAIDRILAGQMVGRGVLHH